MRGAAPFLPQGRRSADATNPAAERGRMGGANSRTGGASRARRRPDPAIPLARRVAGCEWSNTPLGPSAAWPPELKTLVSFILASSFPAAIVWGPGMTTIYNDAFRPILGAKPDALGRSFADAWSE